MGLAISTAWNSLKSNSGDKIIREIKKLGFEEVELNFNLTSLMIKDIFYLSESSYIKIVSVHNFCPIPKGLSRLRVLPDYYSISSPDEDERKLAIHFTKRSIDTAYKFRAKAVVLHCGRSKGVDPTKKLIDLYRKGLKGSPYYRRLKEKMLTHRESIHKTFFKNTLHSLEILNKYAQKRDIILGIENRFYFFEIPSFEEIGIILKKFYGSKIFYWHDTGHAQLQENLGLTKHIDFLSSYSEYMCGIHIHDIKNADDHKAPLQGEIDFNILYPYIKQETLKIMEVHMSSKEKDIIDAKVYLKTILNGKL
ncbi:MAG: sugar phosphate isomerase/epimerase [Candidatus Omnitrophica bacterium]|nr:sugar phosphate isomerase/epimerase [Candidatus Omnitrophota bacterium]